ncbi:MAG: T9SS type A sorting domain-containing protein [Lewinellaceae bacterium]|nr:T9SS type A sorting domain-containing protein [Lewinellaceae bacterium]
MKHCLPLIIFLLAALTVQSQNATKADLSVYPNPTSDYISVNDANDEVSYVVIFNLVGKKVKEFDFIKGESLFIADLPKSMYLVQLQNRKRSVLKTQKVDKR